eukprot:TRINITY_DN41950_c0_g1_i1.p1 TRINITY_DN41950_c0_g1~~TRINITY_DN41950_c0_g1_i1.p1  ORF type:complete len:182 (-),score=66.45 TRINITY_DN41950_c0_g1_i1:208-753(-)
MGAKNSLPMEAVDGFTAEEVSRLEKRFRKLDKDQSETLSVEEFLAMPELKENPIVQRVVQVFDADHSGELDFKEFVKGLAMFTMKNVDREKKLKFLFNIYDMDNDGLISNTELFTVLKMMVGSNLKDTQLQQIVDKTIVDFDKDQDGMINYQEFCDIVGNSTAIDDDEDVTTALTIEVPKV